MNWNDFNKFTLADIMERMSDEGEARRVMELLRWPKGAWCPHCASREVYRLHGKATRTGVWKCRWCAKQFTVTVGTVFEGSHVSLGKWFMAIFLMCSSKKGISSHQLHRTIHVTYKTAWFMTHRIRHMMNEPRGKKFGGAEPDSPPVEADETYVGGKPRHSVKTREKWSTKTPVVALIERGGNVRAEVMPVVNSTNLRRFLEDKIENGSIINTDQSALYHNTLYGLGRKKYTVNHSAKEYARPEAECVAHVNTCESFFSLLKRGMMGAFHHVSPHHLHRYTDEFAFRWNTRKIEDGERMVKTVQAAEGKRLKYKDRISPSFMPTPGKNKRK